MFENIFTKKKKVVSPLIATILLIVVSVILVTVVLTWGKDFVGDSLEDTTSFYQESNLTGFIYVQHIYGNYLTIANKHRTEDVNIVGYQIIPSVDNQLSEYLNERTYNLTKPVYLSSNSIGSFRISCFPERKFILNLITDDNKYISLTVVNNNHLLEHDYLGCYTVFREDFLSEQSVIDNGGIPTNVIFENGVGKFNGTNSSIIYPIKFDGKYTIRIKLISTEFKTHNTLIFDIRTTNLDALNGLSYINNEGKVLASNCIIYVNGVQTNSTILNEKQDIFISDRIMKTGTGNHNLVVGTTPLLNAGWFVGDIELIEVYDKALTLDEIILLYNNS